MESDNPVNANDSNIYGPVGFTSLARVSVLWSDQNAFTGKSWPDEKSRYSCDMAAE